MGKIDERIAKKYFGRWMEADVCSETDLGNRIKLHAKPRVGRAVNNADISCKILKSCRKWYL